MTDEKFILTSNFRRFENSSKKIEESGKILGKDLWVRAHSKENTVERFKREIAPVELNGLNEGTSSKELETNAEWKT